MMPGIVSYEFGVAGCDEGCQKSHLLPETVARLLSQGIPRELIEDSLEYEMTSHGPIRAFSGLTSAGRRNLREWGASDDEITRLELSDAGQREPIQLDFAARERARVGRYRAGLDPETKRARARQHSREYRERKRGGDGAS